MYAFLWSKTWIMQWIMELIFTFYLQGTRGINDFPAVIELEDRVKSYMMENNREVKNTAIGWIMLWLDSFVVHWSKQKDNSMWIHTATILPKPIVIPTYPNYTYCLAMGQSKEDYTEVINHYFRVHVQSMKKTG